MTTLKNTALTLSERLSRLIYTQACKLLGQEGKQLLQQGAHYEVMDLEVMKLELTITLPEPHALTSLADTMARLLMIGQEGGENR